MAQQKNDPNTLYLETYLKWALPRIKANYAESQRNMNQFMNPHANADGSQNDWEMPNPGPPVSMIAEAMGAAPVALADIGRGIGHTMGDIYNSAEVQGIIRETGRAAKLGSAAIAAPFQKVYDDWGTGARDDPKNTLTRQQWEREIADHPEKYPPGYGRPQLPTAPTRLPPAPTGLPAAPMDLPRTAHAKQDVGYINQYPEMYSLRGGVAGQPRNLSHMEPEFERRLSGAIQDYYAATGVPVDIINGSRFPGDQRKIIRQGVPVHARPGGSDHEFGRAADIAEARDSPLFRGILGQHGLRGGYLKDDRPHIGMAPNQVTDPSLVANGVYTPHKTPYYHHSAATSIENNLQELLDRVLGRRR